MLISLLAVGVAGVAAVVALQGWLDALHHRPVAEAKALLAGALQWSTLALCIVLGGFAVYLWRLAGSVRAHERFPPPGMRIVRDTPVLHGAAAVARAVWLRWLAVGLVVCMLAVSIAVWRLLAAFG